eukprot:gene2222-13147_t
MSHDGKLWWRFGGEAYDSINDEIDVSDDFHRCKYTPMGTYHESFAGARLDCLKVNPDQGHLYTHRPSPRTGHMMASLTNGTSVLIGGTTRRVQWGHNEAFLCNDA